MGEITRSVVGQRYGLTIVRVEDPDGGGVWFEVYDAGGKLLNTCPSVEDAYIFVERFKPSISPPKPSGPSCR